MAADKLRIVITTEGSVVATCGTYAAHHTTRNRMVASQLLKSNGFVAFGGSVDTVELFPKPGVPAVTVVEKLTEVLLTEFGEARVAA